MKNLALIASIMLILASKASQDLPGHSNNQSVSAMELANSVMSKPDEQLSIPLPGSPPTHARSFGHVPLSFERNDGQSDSTVKFLARGHGYQLFLTKTEAVMAVLGAV